MDPNTQTPSEPQNSPPVPPSDPTQPTPQPAFNPFPHTAPDAPASPVDSPNILEMGRKRTQNKKRVKVIGVIIGIVLLLGIGVTVLSMMFGMKTVRYENGQGDAYSLTFYADHTVESTSSYMLAKDIPSADKNVTGLYSNVSQDGKAPLGLSITSTKLTPAALATYEQDKGCNGLPVAFTVKNNPTKTLLNVCSLRSQDKDVLYLVLLKDTTKMHTVVITQKIDFKDAVDQESAQAAIDSAGLEAYKDDVKEILASIRPL